MRPEGFNYHTQEISNAVHSILACASLFKQGGDDNTAALLSVLAHHIDENLGEIKALTLPREDLENDQDSA